MAMQAVESSTDSPLWTYRCLRTISSQHQKVAIFCIALHDNVLCSGSRDAQIQVWRHSDGAQLATLNGKSCIAPVQALLMVGHKLFSALQDGKIQVWQFSKTNHYQHRLIASLPTLKDSVSRRFSPKETTCSSIQHSDAVTALATASDVVYSSSLDRTVKVWRLSDLKCLESIPVPEAVTALAANPQGGFLYLVSTGCSAVRVLEKRTAKRSTSQHHLVQVLQESSPVIALAVNPSGTLLYTGSTDSSISVWERRKHPHMSFNETLQGHHHEILCLATTHDLLCSGSADKTTRLWRKSAADRSHSCLATLQHGGPVTCVALTMDKLGSCNLYASSLENQINVWRVSSPCTKKPTLEEHKQEEISTSEMAHWKLDAIKYAVEEGSFHLVLQTLQC